jgi:hypothetical protein
MAIHEKLVGWSVSVHKERRTIPAHNGEKEEAMDIYALIFVETSPPTGNLITFEFTEEVKKAIVAGLTGVVLGDVQI